MALIGALKAVLRGALALAIIGSMSAAAQAQSGIRIHMHGKDGYAADGLLFVPAGEGPFAAIMLIPDERGLRSRVTDTAKSVVEAGYVAVAIDLNRGLAQDAARRSDEQTRLDLDAAFAFLAAQSNVLQDRIGAVGWGSGAISALRLAADGKVFAVAIESPSSAQDFRTFHAIPVPVLAVLPGHDSPATPQSGKGVERRLRALGKRVNVKVYSTAAQGFDDPEDSGHYKPEDAADARRALLDFFAAALRVKASSTQCCSNSRFRATM